jgi:hypothetical protein
VTVPTGGEAGVLERQSIPFLFKKNVREWKAARRPTSSITEIAMQPAYQRIIGLGRPAVPLILAQMEAEGDQPDMWFWALKAITDVDPVAEENRGDVVAMAKAWIDWGAANGVS